MTVQMEWMLSGIIVVENNLNYIVFLQDVSISIVAIDGGISGLGSRSQNAVERRYYWRCVCNVVEECTAKCQSTSMFEGACTY